MSKFPTIIKEAFSVSFVVLLTSHVCFVNAQKNDRTSIQIIFDSIRDSRNDSLKMAMHHRIYDRMETMLQNVQSFDDPFTELPNIGKIYSDDRLVRIYTWSFPLEDKTFQYGGFVQYKKKNVVTTTRLSASVPYLPDISKQVSPTNWYGALYYKIFKVKKKREVYYIALGWSGNNAATDFKTIEPMIFDKNGRLSHFGKAVFKQKGKHPMLRYTMEYNSEGKAALDYQPESKKIIFDHLSPIEPSYQGIRCYYGPDFTYDAFVWQKNEWIYTENIDAINR